MTAKVLIVDDSAMSRRMVRCILEQGGYSVIEAAEGVAALETYFLEKPDLVLLDLVMKGMYGLDVLTKLRELDPGARLVVASADIQSSTRTMVKDAGARFFINKPFVPEQLLTTVSTALAEGDNLDTN